MNNRIVVIAEQVLIAVAIFISFLLLFEHSLVLPAWLQAFGRMHPLLLHFPIVLLVISAFFSFMTVKSASYSISQQWSLNFLLAGNILSSVTIIMGLFLSKEEGYEGATLQWHKWTGVAIFFIGTILYFQKNKKWFSSGLLKTGTVITTLLLIVTGHYGATLTHGEDFVTAPLSVYNTKPVVWEDALVFDDIVKPILQQKCNSCHNNNKAKGDLVLTDSINIAQGGSTGSLFLIDDESLLLERLHLPLDDEKRMPPKGKIQLSDAEIKVLEAWIYHKTPFSLKVSSLPETDSLAIAAAHIMATPDSYDFSAASEKTIQKLINNYRSIRPLYTNSPALSVNIFNASEYSKDQLSELLPIKKQIVFLSANKMPVTDEDLAEISQFENLERLELNFTNISAKGLKHLQPNKNIKYLSIAGNDLNADDLQQELAKLSSLKEVTLWNTGLTVENMQALQNQLKPLRIVSGYVHDESNLLELTPPQVKNKFRVFTGLTAVELFHPIQGVNIHYTIDGTEPDSMSTLFSSVAIDTKATIKAKAYKQGWISSPPIDFQFYKSTFTPDSSVLIYPLNSNHQADGANTFFDKKLGSIGANNPAWANNFAGIRPYNLEMISFFNSPVTLSSVGFRCMVESHTGILPPPSFELWGGDDQQNLKKIAIITPTKQPEGMIGLPDFNTRFDPVTVSCIKIVVTREVIKERPRLVLIDEVFLN